MKMAPNAVNVALELLAERRYGDFARRALGLLYEQRVAYGLRRDLEIPLVPPQAKIPIRIREMQDKDLPALFDGIESGMSRKERVEMLTRRAHLEAAIPTCYVAEDERNGAPCYFQWLMGPQQNARIQAFFPPGIFPVLRADEALLENAYTPVAYRGNGIMSAAMALIAERAATLGCRYVITFVEKDNIASLKGCKRSGFAPYLERAESRFLFNLIRRRRFRALGVS
ncbi:GNAT family N-acetyltransferase [Roseomonas frigidaquae]|uniref:GNAT family N-acetyltransferase n=1 Tax=Falsiroseomonas frigidaquae TaxID=487318 RepID=A0ABX1F7T6_9PROT|nr:GNAT family N-acetyltransferase [Falsiroseomonas frigidaquae]NKE48448.1 GNAT family N-acetyltransferase [Falsiroseomonas frigidaquae]